MVTNSLNKSSECLSFLINFNVDVKELHQESLANPRMLETLEDQVNRLAAIFEKWVKKANELDINTVEETQSMNQVMNDHPERDKANQFPVVRLMQELNMRHIYCRRVAKSCLQKIAENARQHLGLQHQIDLINDSEKFLLRHLPKSPFTAENNYSFIEYKLETIIEKINSYRKIVSNTKNVE